MLGSFDDLNSRIVALLDSHVGGQRNLRHTDAQARVCVVGGTDNLEHGLHDERVVARSGAKAQVDIDQGLLVALEPARLKGNGAAVDGPVCAVEVRIPRSATTYRSGSVCDTRTLKLCSRTWIVPLHAIGKEILVVVVYADGAVGSEVVTSPSRVCKDQMGRSKLEESGESDQH